MSGPGGAGGQQAGGATGSGSKRRDAEQSASPTPKQPRLAPTAGAPGAGTGSVADLQRVPYCTWALTLPLPLVLALELRVLPEALPRAARPEGAGMWTGRERRRRRASQRSLTTRRRRVQAKHIRTGTRAVVNTTLSWKFHPAQRYARPCGVWKIVKFIGSLHLEYT